MCGIGHLPASSRDSAGGRSTPAGRRTAMTVGMAKSTVDRREICSFMASEMDGYVDRGIFMYLELCEGGRDSTDLMEICLPK